jgi:chemotaxis protein CheX
MIATYNQAIEEIAQSVFATMLELELVGSDAPSPEDTGMLLATVHLAGAWTGSVVLALSYDLSAKAAAAMLQLPEDEVSEGDRRDVASELVNMIGGNLKSMLPGPSFLSLPTVVSGHDFGQQVLKAELVDDVLLAFEGMLLRVRLYAKSESDAP